MACYGCKHLIEDKSVGAFECAKCDELTGEQLEKHFVNDEDDCPFREEEDFTEEDNYFKKLKEKTL